MRPQNCKSGRAFRVRFGPKVAKIMCVIRGWNVLFVLRAQKYNKKNSAITLSFFKPNLTFGFFGYDLGFKIVFGFGLIFSGSGRVQAWTSRPVYNSERCNDLRVYSCYMHPTSHTAEASPCSIILPSVKQGRCVNTNFYGDWFDSTGNPYISLSVYRKRLWF